MSDEHADDRNVHLGQGVASMEELAARIARVEARVDELDDGELTINLASRAPDSDAEGTALVAAELHDILKPAYPDIETWVSQHFAPMYARPLGGEFRWCPRWFEHAEAISRLEALWRSWETLRLDPGLGMATWYRDHLDPQLTILLGSRGPFALCSLDRHELVGGLPTQAAPTGYWLGTG